MVHADTAENSLGLNNAPERGLTPVACESIVVERSANATREKPVSFSTSEGLDSPDLEMPGYRRASATKLKYMTLQRVHGLIRIFFGMGFENPAQERLYQAQVWKTTKALALFVSLYHYIVWALITGMLPRPFKTYDYYAFVGIGGALILPLLPLVHWDVPRKQNMLWQIYLFFVTWAFALIIGIRLKTYGSAYPNPQSDFSGFVFYIMAFPALALFSLGESRISFLLGSIGAVIFLGVAVVPQRKSPYTLILINYFLIQIFFMCISFYKELNHRERFILLARSDSQIKSIRDARQAEKEALDAQSRFLNYIFHEMRRPLHTAVLSVQNLDSSVGDSTEQEELINGLKTSVHAIKKVVNDISDLKLMESGALIFNQTPFLVCNVIEHAVTMAQASVPHNVLVDCDIHKDVRALQPLVGDKARLHQVVVNLLTNALKFTSDGTVKVTVQILPPDTELSSHNPRAVSALTPNFLSRPPRRTSVASELVNLRFEISDTGAGIENEVITSNSLFSAFISTESGRRLGGKGAGLGLAMVRHIVTLSQGRLGVKSELGVGSTFWVEMSYRQQTGRKPSLVPTQSDKSSVVQRKDPVMTRATGSTDTITRMSSYLPSSDPITRMNSYLPSSTPIKEIASPILIVPELPTSPKIQAKVQESDGDTAPSHKLTSEKTIPIDDRPAADAEKIPVTTTIAMTNPDNTEKKVLNLPRILVVDDDALTRKLVSRTLERLGHATCTAVNGQDALDQIQARSDALQPFELILLDNQMPVLSGVEMVAKLRSKEDTRAYVCGITGNSLDADRQEFLDAGADKVLFKPVGKSDLDAVVRIVLQ